jgi:uncharacterized membrane protein YdjX (TVP38/TMEM64 family)
MIAFVLSLVLIVIIALLGKYTSFMTEAQNKFILVSAVLYIIIFGVILSMLTDNKGLLEVFMNNSTYIPLIFYILWYVVSAAIANIFTGRNDYIGFFEDTHKYMSKRNLMPR